jgi:hypothetical protein
MERYRLTHQIWDDGRLKMNFYFFESFEAVRQFIYTLTEGIVKVYNSAEELVHEHHVKSSPSVETYA